MLSVLLHVVLFQWKWWNISLDWKLETEIVCGCACFRVCVCWVHVSNKAENSVCLDQGLCISPKGCLWLIWDYSISSTVITMKVGSGCAAARDGQTDRLKGRWRRDTDHLKGGHWCSISFSPPPPSSSLLRGAYIPFLSQWLFRVNPSSYY